MNYPKQLDAELARWTRKASTLIERGVDDAAAQAGRVIVRRLRAKGGGRLATTKGYIDATRRLNELRVALVGSPSAPLDGLLRDAREAFFRLSFVLWPTLLDKDWYDFDRGPSKDGVRTAREAIIMGLDLESEMEGVFDSAARQILATVNLVGSAATSADQADDMLESWRRTTTDVIRSRASRVLLDSEVALWWAVEVALQR